MKLLLMVKIVLGVVVVHHQYGRRVVIAFAYYPLRCQIVVYLLLIEIVGGLFASARRFHDP